jgi:heme exporter protein B|tara:strand:+ start:65739 stop:66401 length:663 start_codon:yes stop_codon:yes gene_type:complete
MLKKIFIIIKKDLKIDISQGHMFFSVALYLISSIFVVYLSFGSLGIKDLNTWVSLFWVIILFGAITSISKSFLYESKNRNYYYYFLFTPTELILSKLIYNFIFLSLLCFVAFGFYSLLVGNFIQSISFFILFLFIGAFSISNCLTLISAISNQVRNNSAIMSVLSFPIILPILLILINISKISASEFSWNLVEDDIYLLILLNIIVLVLSKILFGFLWRS